MFIERRKKVNTDKRRDKSNRQAQKEERKPNKERQKHKTRKIKQEKTNCEIRQTSMFSPSSERICLSKLSRIPTLNNPQKTRQN